MQWCNVPIGQHPQAHLLCRRQFVNLISLQRLNTNLIGKIPSNSNLHIHTSKSKTLDVKCSASSADTATKTAEWPPLEGNFTYKQLRALPVSKKLP